jgi:hypothetical protein
MAKIRNRSTVANIVTPNKDTIIEPNQDTKNNQNYESILEKIQELENKNKVLETQIARANNDISKDVVESTRKY